MIDETQLRLHLENAESLEARSRRLAERFVVLRETHQRLRGAIDGELVNHNFKNDHPDVVEAIRKADVAREAMDKSYLARQATAEEAATADKLAQNLVTWCRQNNCLPDSIAAEFGLVQ